MKLHQKIRKIREEKNLTLRELHNKIVDIFGRDALTYWTLRRIENGESHKERASHLHQICLGLDTTLKELKTGTEEENKLVDFIAKDKRPGRYVYNEKVYAEMLMHDNRAFIATELILLPSGKTKIEEDPIEVGKFEKLVYGLQGKIVCIVGKEKHILNKGDSLSFESNTPHWFENNTSKKSRCLVVQNPKYI